MFASLLKNNQNVLPGIVHHPNRMSHTRRYKETKIRLPRDFNG